MFYIASMSTDHENCTLVDIQLANHVYFPRVSTDNNKQNVYAHQND